MTDAQIEVHDVKTEDATNTTNNTGTHDEEPITATLNVDPPMPPVPEEATTSEEPKAKAKQRGGRQKKSEVQDLKEKVVCPDCSKSVSLHSLKFTHKKYCKAKKIEVEQVDKVAQEIIHNLQVSQSTDPEVHHVQYDPEQVAMDYIKNVKAQKKETKRAKYKQMLAGKL